MAFPVTKPECFELGVEAWSPWVGFQGVAAATSQAVLAPGPGVYSCVNRPLKSAVTG